MKTLLAVSLFLMMVIVPSSALAEIGADLESKYGVVTDAALNARLERVGMRVSLATQKLYPKCKKLRYKILKDEDLNAMALPDGRIYITSGMMGAVTSDDQLAFVLGHEATHVAQKHSRHQTEGFLLGAILGVGVSLATGGDSRDAIGNGVQIGGVMPAASHCSRSKVIILWPGPKVCKCLPTSMAAARLVYRFWAGSPRTRTPKTGWSGQGN